MDQYQNNTNSEVNTNNQEEKLIYQSGIYWRKSNWNGFRTVPVILRMTDKHLLMMDKKGQIVFNILLNSFSVKMSKYGTLFIITENKKYAIVGMGAAVSRGFSKQELEILKESSVKNDTSTPNRLFKLSLIDEALVSFGRMSGPMTGVAGVGGIAMATVAFYFMEKNTNKWFEIFQENGIKTSGKKSSIIGLLVLMLLASLVLIVSLFIILILAVLIFGNKPK